MGNVRRWSQTATGNASVAGGANTINWAEGQAPGSVNNSAREMMAQLRGIYTPDEWGWVEFSATASVASQTVFKLPGNQTTAWTANRRWRLKSGSTTRYGSVVSSSYTTETTITVTVDSGSLSASHSLVALASIDSNHIPANNYITSNSASAMITTRFADAALTGTPTAPTASAYTNTTQIASTAQTYSTVTTVPENAQTGTTYTLVLADAGKMVTLANASAITLTIPLNSSVAFPVGTRIDIAQGGAGQVTVSAAVGATLRSSNSKVKLSGQYSGATLWKQATNTWWLIGDLA